MSNRSLAGVAGLLLGACATAPEYDPVERVPPFGEPMALCQRARPWIPAAILGRRRPLHVSTVVSVDILQNGKIGTVRVVKSSLDETFDEVVVETAKAMKCTTLAKDFGMTVQMTYTFDMR